MRLGRSADPTSDEDDRDRRSPPSPNTVAATGIAFVRAPEMRALLEAAGLRDWDGFAASWDDLGVDTYMADGGRYRRRRFACFRADAERRSRANRISRITRAATTTR